MSRRLFILSVQAILVAFLSASTVSGQGQAPSDTWNLYDAGTPSGRSSTTTQTPAAFKGGESPASASINIRETLVSLPGRGLNAGVSLNYNTPQHLHQYPYNQVISANYLSEINGWDGFGFEMGYGKLVFHHAQYGFPDDGPIISTLYEPDGTAHRIMQDYTVDGSDIKLSYPLGSNLPTITYPNGTVIRYGARADNLNGQSGDWFYFPVRITDRNGNYIEIFYENNKGPRITKVVDTLGREIIFNTSGGKLSSISVPGQTLNTRVESARFYYEDGSYIYSFNNQSKQYQANYLRYVYIPATKSGWHYYYSSYGMIYRVEKLQGMEVDAGGSITNYGQVVAWTEYDYPRTPSNLSGAPRFTQRTDNWSGNTGSTITHTFSHYYDLANRLSVATTYAPDGTSTETQRRFYGYNDAARGSVDIYPMALWDEGLVIKSKVTKGTRSYVTDNQWEETPGGGRLKQTITTNEAGQQKKVVYAYQPMSTTQTSAFSQNYGPCNNVTEVKEYGFDGVQVKRVVTAYETNTAWTNRGLLRLPTSVKVYAGTSTSPLTQVDYAYDAGPALVTYGSLDMYDTSTPAHRGNLTAITRNSNAANPSQGVTVTESYGYDIAGNKVSYTNPRGHTSQTEYSADNRRAYPTRIISAVPGAGSDPLITSTVYNFNTGLVTSNKDANDRLTSYTYDVSGRLKMIERPDGGWSTYDYSVAPGNFYVYTRTALDNSRYLESYQHFNGRGWPVRSIQSEGSSWSVIDTQYDVMGRVWRVSRPYRSADSSGGNVNPSDLWTTSIYDEVGRITSVTTPDGAKVTTEYDGNATTVLDQTNRARRMFANALGHLVKVVEDPNRNGHTGLNYETIYTYDVTGNLRKVQQDGQTRFFMYDSLGRLIRARNPEETTLPRLDHTDVHNTALTGNTQWSLAYDYDANGNLKSRVDARNAEVVYGYDNLNRRISITYLNDPQSTPPVEIHYDGATNGKGLFWYNVIDAANGTHRAIDSYDAMGRPLVQRYLFATSGDMGGGTYWRNRWWSAPYAVTRAYDKSGNMTSQTYPSGHAVTYNYDGAGRLGDYDGQPAFAGNIGDGVQRTYATDISYDESGGIRQERFGTQTPLYHKLHYNVRGQLYDIRLSTAAWATDEWNWDRGCLAFYFGGYPHQQSGPLNNGNISAIQHWAPLNEQATDYVYTEDRYDYDALNRLKSVSEYHGTPSGLSGRDFAQFYNYDRWGNRTINQTETTNGINKLRFEVNSNTNQLQVPAGFYGRMDYDAAGNLVNDTYSSYGHDQGSPTRIFDAENRMTAVKNGQLQVVSSYVYDADGRRVRRLGGGQEVWQVHGPDGDLLAEYQAGAAPYIATKEYGYRGGELLVTAASGDPGRMTRLIKNLYYNALARDPSATEMQQRTATLTQAGLQGQPQLLTAARAMARAVFESAEYTQRNRTNEQYVTDLYNAYLQRGPDQGGLNHWVNDTQVNGRGATLNAFEASGEFEQLSQMLYGIPQGGDNQRVEHFVRTFYQGAQRREPTAAELQQQTARLNNAATRSEAHVIAEARAMALEIFQATSYNSTRTNEEYVTDLYQAFLQRAPDTDGFNHWVGGVTSNGRPAVLAAFQVSGEYTELARTLYREVFWLVSDHLGTPRMTVAKAGTLIGIKRHDYLPFGEEMAAEVGARTTNQGYSQQDGTRQKWAQLERDDETGLDFAQARYYSNVQGRFTSVDPENQQAKRDISDPQSWNAYAYVNNNPLSRNDPTGTDFWDRLKNAFFYGYYVENDQIEKLEQERREWLSQHYYERDEQGNWQPFDASTLSRQDVFDKYREVKFFDEKGKLHELSNDEIIQAWSNVNPALKGDPFSPEEVAKRQNAELNALRNKMQSVERAAERLGFDRRIAPQKAPFNSHGQEVFTDGKRFITRDIDGHNGGVWKMFDRAGKRLGTYNDDLTVRIGK